MTINELRQLDRSFGDEYVMMYPEKKMPREVTFIVTESCNLRCSYCYQHNKSARVMAFETAQKCVDTLFAEDARGSEYINPIDAPALILDFIGGEPLLEIDLIDRIVDYFLSQAISRDHRWQTQYMISMSTNGTRYFDERVQRFLEKHKGRVSMSVTIDGNERLHDACRLYPDGRGSYAEAAAAFRDILSRYNQHGTKLTIAPANLPFLYEAVVSMKAEFGITELHANCVYEKGWEIADAKTMYDQLKQIADWLIETGHYADYAISLFDTDWYQPMKENDDNNWCGGTGQMLAFGVDGVIYPCLRYAPASLGKDVKPLVVGHIDHGIEATPEEQATTNMLRAITRRSQSTDECFNCPVARGCAWCSAYNYEVNGTPDKRATFTCWMHRAQALANVYYWNRLARLLESDERFPLYLPKEIALEIIDEKEYDALAALTDKA